MLTELRGKGGSVCEPARTGKLVCPLLVRPTSEDVLTGHLFQVLGVLNPRWWLSDLLNYGLGAPRFRRQNFHKFRITLWKSRSHYPRELLPWREGRSEIDVTLEWENPPTTVFIEMKYRSGISLSTEGDDGSSGFPSDQLIRNARVGLLETGWFDRDQLFHLPPRDFCLLLVGLDRGNRLVRKYRNMDQLRKSIPHSHRLPKLPPAPFIGELNYASIVHILQRQRRLFTRAERLLIDDLVEYLKFKTTTNLKSNPRNQRFLELPPDEGSE